MTEASEQVPAGSVDELRQEAMTDLDLCAHYCGLASGHLSTRADAGAYYSTRQATAHLKTAIGSLKLLGERMTRELREIDERRADHGLNGPQRRGERA